MEDIIKLLHKGYTLEQVAEKLQKPAATIRSGLISKYPLPKLQKTVGVELEGFSTLGYSGVINALKKQGIDIQFRDWQEQSLTGITNWTLTTDGTVKGFPGQSGQKGMEIVSPPLSSLETLQKVVEAIRDGEVMGGMHHRFKINRTCGLHVHVGTQGMDKVTLEKVYTVYRILESYLDLMLSESRGFNDTHCKTIHSLSFKEAILSTTTKYWSVRTKVERPTIEFRKHQASTSFHRIQYWILILQQIILYAEKNTMVSILKNKPSFAYLYEVLSNPNLIAYFNARRKTFEDKKEVELPKNYLEKVSNDLHKRLMEGN